MKDQYIKAAPEFLKPLHERQVQLAEDADEGSYCIRFARVLGALTQDKKMDRVWVTFIKKKGGSPPDEGKEREHWAYRFCVDVLIADEPLKSWERQGHARKKERLLELAKKSRAAAKAMRSTMDLGYFYALHMVTPEGEVEADEYRVKVQALTGHEPLLLSVNSWLDHGLDISLSDVLDRFSQSCEQEAAKPPVVHGEKLRANSVEVTAFVRRLAPLVKDRFGSSLPECVARITNAVHSTDITALMVRDICKTSPSNNRIKRA